MHNSYKDIQVGSGRVILTNRRPKDQNKYILRTLADTALSLSATYRKIALLCFLEAPPSRINRKVYYIQLICRNLAQISISARDQNPYF
ncbi:hypothetical protein L1887_26773 [Cichorium endivia]|nr:hypothetical protein L1887_26773 [Cichorium endivia]